MKKITHTARKRLFVASFLGLLMFGVAVSPVVFADRYQEQINSLNNDSANKQGSVGQLGAEATNLQDAIARLQSQISGLQAQIGSTEARRNQTQAEIKKAEADLATQRQYLADSVKASYVDGGVSSLEMLASSQDINQFVDQQQYQNSVQGQLERTLETIKKLQEKLASDKANLERMLADLSSMRANVVSQQAEQSRLLSLNQEQQSALNSQIVANNSKVADLRKQQALENARLSAGSGSSAPGTGPACGGGYPGSRVGPWGSNWGCNYALDNTIDNWGMYNRQCVSYTAFKVEASGRYMPKWGLLGKANAKQWDDNAIAAGIPVDRSPRVGDVAVSNAGDYGHVMYVEAVAADGSINVSDYNQQWDGRYRNYWITADTVSSKNLMFIHF